METGFLRVIRLCNFEMRKSFCVFRRHRDSAPSPEHFLFSLSIIYYIMYKYRAHLAARFEIVSRTYLAAETHPLSSPHLVYLATE